MLQHNPQRHATGAAESHDLQGAFGRYLERLLQKNVLAGLRGAPDQIEMRVGRRQDEDGVDAAVRQNRIEAIGERKIEPLGKGPAPFRAWAECLGDLHPVLEIQKALGMGADRHAEADECDATLRHSLPPLDAPTGKGWAARATGPARR